MTDGRTAHAEPMRRAPRWLLAALFASLALNLVVVGLVAGAMWRFHAPVWTPITPSLLGYIAFDPAKNVVTRFDMVALGNVSGRPLNENNMGERPGSNPLGVAFELVVNPTPADLLFPRGARDNSAAYLGKK